MPEISIVLPVYNVEPFLCDCLNSILRQTFQDWEAILVDDGSTDFSGIICNSYSRKDHRFHVIHQENAGVSAARNAGIDAATAPLLSFIDPDDFVSRNYFESMIQEMRSIGASVAVSSFRTFQEDGAEGKYKAANQLLRYRERRFPCKMMSNAEVINAVCKDVFGCGCWGKIYRHTLWGETRFPVGIDLGEDEAVVPPTIIRAERAVYVPAAEYFYRQRGKSLLHGTVTAERLRKNFQASRAMLQNLTEYAPERAADFSLLRLGYDFGCVDNYFRSNPGVARGKSRLFALMQAIGEQDGDDSE